MELPQEFPRATEGVLDHDNSDDDLTSTFSEFDDSIDDQIGRRSTASKIGHIVFPRADLDVAQNLDFARIIWSAAGQPSWEQQTPPARSAQKGISFNSAPKRALSRSTSLHIHKPLYSSEAAAQTVKS
ncbi:hypothetical protein NHQ30_011355 [Ciborinia camelliae]|nr:hypothetical protein NHQ30_011355 [Ciborinia camelliae]